MPVQRIDADDARTWTVVGSDLLPVAPIEEFLEFQRMGRLASPNTVRSYATSLSIWWDYLAATRLAWDAVTLRTFTPFVAALRSGTPFGVTMLPQPSAHDGGGLAEATVAVRVAAVLSFYRFHGDVHGVAVGARLYRVGSRRAGYVSALDHLRRERQSVQPAVRVRRTAAGRPTPVLMPEQVEAILDACAYLEPGAAGWRGSVRDRLLFATMAETGMRLGECLSTHHCDWHVGRGDSPFIDVVPRQDHPAARVKGGRYRRIYISDDLERLHSEYVWQLCEADAHRVVDLDGHFVFVNLHRGRWLAPMRPETVYDLVASLKRRLGAAVPAEWTPHWFRHTHASALLASGASQHVVMRRLGHADIQTTISLYGWVSEEDEMRALAGWRRSAGNWRALAEADHG
jgi:integrase/recombinase XerD